MGTRVGPAGRGAAGSRAATTNTARCRARAATTNTNTTNTTTTNTATTNGYYAPPPLVPPPVDEGVHTHEGFYLRVGFGFGYGEVKSEVDDLEATYKGTAWLMDVLIGGTISNTVTFGGGFLIHQIVSPDVEVSSEEWGPTSGEADDVDTVSANTLTDTAHTFGVMFSVLYD